MCRAFKRDDSVSGHRSVGSAAARYGLIEEEVEHDPVNSAGVRGS